MAEKSYCGSSEWKQKAICIFVNAKHCNNFRTREKFRKSLVVQSWKLAYGMQQSQQKYKYDYKNIVFKLYLIKEF